VSFFPKINFVDEFPVELQEEIDEQMRLHNFFYFTSFTRDTIVGTYFRETKHIYVLNRLNKRKKVKVLFHELTHWLIHTLGDIKILHNFLDRKN
jgi:Zn-dependent peptidase ImmA (M78 family)